MFLVTPDRHRKGPVAKVEHVGVNVFNNCPVSSKCSLEQHWSGAVPCPRNSCSVFAPARHMQRSHYVRRGLKHSVLSMFQVCGFRTCVCPATIGTGISTTPRNLQSAHIMSLYTCTFTCWLLKMKFRSLMTVCLWMQSSSMEYRERLVSWHSCECFTIMQQLPGMTHGHSDCFRVTHLQSA